MLVMAVTGAWAEIDTHWPDFNSFSYNGNSDLVAGITIDGVFIDSTYVGWDQLEVAAFVGDECRSAGDGVNYLNNDFVVEYGDPYPLLNGMNLYYNGEGGETVTFKMYNHATGVEYTTYTLTLNGEPISILTGEAHQEGWDDPANPIFLNFTSSAASATYNVDMQAGTEDGTSWTAKTGEGQYQQLPLTGVAEGTLVTVAYGGKKRVKSIKVLPDMRYEPLTVEALTDGKVRVVTPKSGMKCLKNGDAITWTTNYGDNDIAVVAGDKLQFYGNGTSITSYNNTTISGGTADGMADVKVYGNIMSLVDEEGFATATTLTANNVFTSLFSNYKNLKDASGLLLPATTLAEYCYSDMFSSCTSLTASPVLPATTLSNTCYLNMFNGCKNLSTVTCLASAPGNSCTNWLYNVAASGTFYAPSTANYEGKTNNSSGIPSGWTHVDYVAE